VVNLLSTNGVFVNGQKVFSHLLSNGDEIRLGRTRLRFVDPNSDGRRQSAGAGRWLTLAAIAVVAAAALVWLLR
jgi:pSer/pThr/pTyr-binding forkhead associated (FHA) protein